MAVPPPLTAMSPGEISGGAAAEISAPRAVQRRAAAKAAPSPRYNYAGGARSAPLRVSR